MKAKKLLALLLAVALVVTQFAMLGSVFAETTALTGRETYFAKGVNIHSYAGYAAYTDTAKVISDAAALGSDIIRTNIVDDNLAYNVSVADMAAKKGMQVMAIAGFKYWENSAPIAAANIDIAGITKSFTEMATALKGKVAYYQINNEMCNQFIRDGILVDNTSASGFKDVSGVAAGLNAAYDAIKAVDPNAKVVVNFCWTHYGLLKALKNANAKWDVTGFDWYYTSEKSDTYYKTVINDVVEAFNKPVIVCEANVKAKGYNSDGSVNYNKDASWLGNFVKDCYADENVIGFIAYELYDQPAFESGSFNEQSHFGLIDKNGNKKDTYTALCTLYGGTGSDTAWYSPEMKTSEGQLTFKTGEAFAGSYGVNALSDAWLPRYNPSVCPTAGNAETDFTQYDFIEFDYYVEDIDALKSKVTDINVGLMHYSGGADEKFSYINQLTKNGWNHVKVAIDVSGDREWVIKRATQVRFRLTTTDSVVGATDPYIIANIAVTCAKEIVVPEMVQSEGMYIIENGVKYSGVLGANAINNGYLPGYTTIYTPVSRPGFDKYDYFEFDYYVEDIDNFKARVSSLKIVLYHNSGKEKAFECIDKITKSGWNHVKVKISYDNDTEKTILNNACQVKFYTTMSAGGVGAADRYKLANICATKDTYNTIPAMPQSEGMLVINEGAKYSGKLGTAALSNTYLPGYTTIYTPVSSPKFDTYDYFEFDYFVDDIDNFKARVSSLKLALYHNSGKEKAFECIDKITQSGWNHIKINISYDNDTEKIILNNAIQVKFYITMSAGEVGAEDRYKVANICATKKIEIVVPEMVQSEGMYVIENGTKYSKTLGTAAITNGYLPGYSTIYTPVSAPKFDTYDYFEFDYYVENIDNFKARVSSLKLALYHNSGKEKSFEFADKLTKSGWNHVKITISYDNDTEKIILNNAIQVKFYTTMSAGDTGAEDRYVVANICATKDVYNDIPAMPDSEGMFVVNSGAKYAGELGTAALSNTYLPGYGTIYNAVSAPEFDTYDYFEFDYYVENIDNFKARVSSLKIALYHNSGKEKAFECIDKITKSGWNHVKVKISYNDDIEKIILNNAIQVKFYTTMSAGEVGATDRYKVANICATKIPTITVPEMVQSEGMYVIENGAKYSKTLGTAAITNGYLPGYSTIYTPVSSPKFDTYDYFEFDYYVENINNFKSRVSSLKLALYHNSGKEKAFECIDKITQSGWNHVKIIISYDNDTEKTILNNAYQVKFYTTMSAGDVGAEDRYVVANICATKGVYNKIPEMTQNSGTFVINEGAKYSGTLGSAALSNTYLPGYGVIYTPVSYPKFDTYDYFEFDYYVEDIDNFKARVSSLKLALYHNSGKEKAFECIDKITQSGWNHVKIEISYNDSTEKTILNNAIQVKFYTTMSAGDVGTKDRYKLANICATKHIANVIPEVNNVYRTMDSIPGVQHSIELAPGENPLSYSTNKHFFKLSKALDTSNADYIEMDIYVSADVDTGATIWVSGDRESAANRGRYDLPNNLKAGWNHVVIKGDEPCQVQGSFNLKGTEFDYPYLESKFYTAEHPTGGLVKIANISVTCDITAPTDVMENKESFIDDLDFANFDENGMYMVEFESAMDISSTKMIELDIFVSDEALDAVNIDIMDADGNYAMYDFSGLTKGWNHLAVRICDLIPGEENVGEIDLTNIAYFTLWGAANTDFVVANAYAADYIEGDANRDGVLDLKDVVRAKKIFAGLTNEGNKLAISGVDYEIDSADLVDLSNIVIAALFK